MPLDGFNETTFAYGGKSRSIFTKGAGPGVIVVHEAPGITPFVQRFGSMIADRGFTAVLPSLFGVPGKPSSPFYVNAQLGAACISREFRCFSKGQSSPVTDWLRALSRDVHLRCGGSGVGAVGMCLTGGFALSMMIDESVMAPVLSQPSLPLPVTKSHAAAIGISADELAKVRQRVSNGCHVLGLRFSEDVLCRRERFQSLRRELGANFEIVEIDSSSGNPFGISANSHSVLTSELVVEPHHPTMLAFERVVTFLHERLT